jgi:hypothetical protein
VYVGPRHVWVKLDDTARAPDPGLLLMWRKGRRGWQAWVIWTSYIAGHDQLDVRQAWLDEALVSPAQQQGGHAGGSGGSPKAVPRRQSDRRKGADSRSPS